MWVSYVCDLEGCKNIKTGLLSAIGSHDKHYCCRDHCNKDQRVTLDDIPGYEGMTYYQIADLIGIRVNSLKWRVNKFRLGEITIDRVLSTSRFDYKAHGYVSPRLSPENFMPAPVNLEEL